MTDHGPAEERALVYAPTGRDAAVAQALLGEASIGSCVCSDLDVFVRELGRGAGLAIVTEEALARADLRAVSEWIESQPPWSDLPFVILTGDGGSLERNPARLRLMAVLGNVSLLERPFHPVTFVSIVRTALRARRRQYEARAYLRDIERSAEHQTLLLHELSHRVKNTLANVQAIAALTLRLADSPEEFRRAFDARLQSLSHTHDLLTASSWQGAALRDVALGELTLYGDVERRFALDGQAVRLGPNETVALGMAFHELATNASKYGALSVPAGRIEIAWRCRRNGKSDCLHLEWIEKDGPPVHPPERRGFGTQLIERSLARALAGEVQLIFAPEGVRCSIEFALDLKAA